jgi:hypothetical protein
MHGLANRRPVPRQTHRAASIRLWHKAVSITCHKRQSERQIVSFRVRIARMPVGRCDTLCAIPPGALCIGSLQSNYAEVGT